MTDGLAQPRMIELSFPWNVDEVITAERQAFKRFCRPVFRILLYEVMVLFGLGLVFLVFALGVKVWRGGSLPDDLWATLWPFALMLALAGPNIPLLRHLKLRWQPSASLQGEMRWLITDELLQVTPDSRVSLQIPWNSVSEVGRNEKGFLFFLAGPPAFPLLPRQPGLMTYLWLPSHAFGQAEDLSAFEHLVSRRSRMVVIN